MANELPSGFIELHCVPSGAVWHVRADSIAAYGPEERDSLDQLLGCPVQLRGQPRSESRLVDGSVRLIARLCIATEKACAPVPPGDECPARHEAIAPGSWCSKCGERRQLWPGT